MPFPRSLLIRGSIDSPSPCQMKLFSTPSSGIHDPFLLSTHTSKSHHDTSSKLSWLIVGTTDEMNQHGVDMRTVSQQIDGFGSAACRILNGKNAQALHQYDKCVVLSAKDVWKSKCTPHVRKGGLNEAYSPYSSLHCALLVCSGNRTCPAGQDRF